MNKKIKAKIKNRTVVLKAINILYLILQLQQNKIIKQKRALEEVINLLPKESDTTERSRVVHICALPKSQIVSDLTVCTHFYVGNTKDEKIIKVNTKRLTKPSVNIVNEIFADLKTHISDSQISLYYNNSPIPIERADSWFTDIKNNKKNIAQDAVIKRQIAEIVTHMLLHEINNKKETIKTLKEEIKTMKRQLYLNPED